MTRTAQTTLLHDYHLLSYDQLDSTNAESRRLAGGGASHGAVIWAKRQTAGRGRMGREWVSSEGNLYVTVLVHPPVALDQCPQLSFVAALAVAETLEGIVPDPAKVACKWPNDVLVGGKKKFPACCSRHSPPKNWRATSSGLPWALASMSITSPSM